ncbi:uncharacterized protein LOC129056091 [Pongo abelii]|uniref:uncharacterized protein LOC129056091 n=1 Tax=Pongo abelii TaxID=9601 RepID=UPI003003D6C2
MHIDQRKHQVAVFMKGVVSTERKPPVGLEKLRKGSQGISYPPCPSRVPLPVPAGSASLPWAQRSARGGAGAWEPAPPSPVLRPQAHPQQSRERPSATRPGGASRLHKEGRVRCGCRPDASASPLAAPAAAMSGASLAAVVSRLPPQPGEEPQTHETLLFL